MKLTSVLLYARHVLDVYVFRILRSVSLLLGELLGRHETNFCVC